jgi:hypothetical protein
MTRFGCFADLRVTVNLLPSRLGSASPLHPFAFSREPLKAQWLGRLLRMNSAAGRRL